jgi:hypothetical protein
MVPGTTEVTAPELLKPSPNVPGAQRRGIDGNPMVSAQPARAPARARWSRTAAQTASTPFREDARRLYAGGGAEKGKRKERKEPGRARTGTLATDLRSILRQPPAAAADRVLGLK